MGSRRKCLLRLLNDLLKLPNSQYIRTGPALPGTWEPYPLCTIFSVILLFVDLEIIQLLRLYANLVAQLIIITTSTPKFVTYDGFLHLGKQGGRIVGCASCEENDTMASASSDGSIHLWRIEHAATPRNTSDRYTSISGKLYQLLIHHSWQYQLDSNYGQWWDSAHCHIRTNAFLDSS